MPKALLDRDYQINMVGQLDFRDFHKALYLYARWFNSTNRYRLVGRKPTGEYVEGYSIVVQLALLRGHRILISPFGILILFSLLASDLKPLD